MNPAVLVQLPMLMNGLRMASLVFSNVDKYKWIYAYCALELYNYQSTDAVPKRTKIINLLDIVNDAQITAQLSNYDAKFGNFGNTVQEANFKAAIENYIFTNINKKYNECSLYLQELLKIQDCCISDLKHLLHGLELALIIEESKGNNAARSHSTTLIARIENIIQTYSNTLFDSNPHKIKRFEEITLFNKALTVFDVSSYENQDLLFLSSYIMRNIFENQKRIKNMDQQIEKVYHFLLDEAHRYITEENDVNNIQPKKIFERISKEGRKFGVFMIIASQRPGELSKTVLSQCNNYILHRIRNNLDLEQLKKSIPYLNDLQIFRLSFLKSGTALFVGDAFTFPMEIEVDGEEYSYTSSTVDLINIWS
ncbi:hypothetical protein JOC25_000403 [Solibacillus kalamii]|uniref:ATP-binding protein n=1 Tax=Solibacillus kalamii TaxID=1748298 RepID=A0ABX3ZJ62_9BACL|nr:ATP-binding protein [Solibacillus kalamii]MBM7663947.1 hypothetical protein [Solibacillus kalamii]OUZ39575.1 hypothetical protein CBM15_07920 [Solibacillus kalamii]